MASHHQITVRPRCLANVLSDIREASWDLERAQEEVRNATLGLAYSNQDAEDRATEAETRLSDLRCEFSERFIDATGLTVEQLRNAYSEALI